MTHNADPLEELLRAAGPRATAPTDRARRVEAVVRLEWQDAVQETARPPARRVDCGELSDERRAARAGAACARRSGGAAGARLAAGPRVCGA